MRPVRIVAIFAMTIAGLGVLPRYAIRAQTSPSKRDVVGFRDEPRVSADSLFRAGRALIGMKDYRGAEDLLQRVADEYPNSDQARTALYWRAWAFDAAGLAAHDTVQLRAALVTIASLEARYPTAPLAKDTRWLRADIIDDQAAFGDPVAKQAVTAATARVLKAGISCESPDVELELVAVQRHVSLYLYKMPGLADLLLSTQGACARDAELATITALGSAPTPVATRALMDVVRDRSDSGLRADALNVLQTVHTKEAALFLDSVVRADQLYAARAKQVEAALEAAKAKQGAQLDSLATRRAELQKAYAVGLLRARPLALPSLASGQPCPKERPRTVYKQYGPAIGKGPAFVAQAGPDSVLSWADSPGSLWRIAKTLWFLDPAYHGPVLIRGGSLDGKEPLRFDSGVDPAQEIVMDAPDSSRSGRYAFRELMDSLYRARPSSTRVRAPGCYAYQIDGIGFSETIVFEVRP